MPKYEVLTRINLGEKTYQPGDEISLSRGDAEKMPWAVRLPQEAAPDEEPKQPVVIQPPANPPVDEAPGGFQPGEPIRVKTEEYDETAVVALKDFQRKKEEFNQGDVLRVNSGAVERLAKDGKVRLATLEEVQTPHAFAQLRRADGR